MHRVLLSALAAMLAIASPARAQSNAFDLTGPALTLTVTRGDLTLPIAHVPALHIGDRLTVKADLPPDQSVRYLLIVAFLRGATNPPPKKWFFAAETWKPRKAVLTLSIPEGAGQAVAFLAPETGGGFDAVVGAVRARPGAFVRAAQELHQASLDRARLESFVAAVARLERGAPEALSERSPIVANMLGIRFNAECLTRQRALRAACLIEGRDDMVLQSMAGGATLADRLTGAPMDVADRIAATREGGGGFYSPYIGLARDLVRLFGAFRTAQYQYLPALTVGQGDGLQLRLNTAPSFKEPRSVLVAALPPVDAVAPPVWRASAREPSCIARPGLVLGIENAPLLYATAYARELALRVTMADGRVVDLPLVADAERGGLVVDAAGAAALGASTIARAALQGRWGFDRFEGPAFALRGGTAAAWTPQPGAAVVVGRDHPLVLRGGVAACVDRLVLGEAAGDAQPLAWKAAAADAVEVTLPLARVKPGPLTLRVTHFGDPLPATIALVGQVEAARLDAFVLHEGDGAGVLSGSRLDQVAGMVLGDASFAPGALTRDQAGDRLVLASTAARSPPRAGESREAVVRLRDGRTMRLRVAIASPRPQAVLTGRSVELPPTAAGLALMLPEATLPPAGRLTFSLRREGGGFQPEDGVEVATVDGSARALLSVASGGLQRVGDATAVATIEPRQALGPAVVGPLRFRPVRGGVTGDWQPLAQVVHLPTLERLDCPAEGGDCILTGHDLFALAAVADTPDFTRGVAVPSGFVGTRIVLPRPSGPQLYLRLSDASDAVAQVALGAAFDGAGRTTPAAARDDKLTR